MSENENKKELKQQDLQKNDPFVINENNHNPSDSKRKSSPSQEISNSIPSTIKNESSHSPAKKNNAKKAKQTSETKTAFQKATLKNKKSKKIDKNSSEESTFTTVMKEVLTEENPTDELTWIKPLDDTSLIINDQTYQIVSNYRNAFQIEKLDERYSEVLQRYDYIVGDWGYDQLRLRGFFADQNHQASLDQRIGTVEDYLYEFCNFGCAYFVLEKMGKKSYQTNKNKRRRSNKRRQQEAFIHEKKGPTTKQVVNKQVNERKKTSQKDRLKEQREKKQNSQDKTTKKKQNFVIRKKES